MQMFIMIVLAGMVSAGIVWGDQLKDFYLNDQQQVITKTQAMKALLMDGQTRVLKCYEVELSDKVTIRRKK